MALSTDEIRSAAERLDQAEKTRKQIRQISLEHPGITIADAYAIQKAWVEMKVAQGRIVKGHKIGLTSKAMQSALNIDEPDSGILLDDMFFADGGLVPSDRFIATRVEAELAFVMKTRLSGTGLHDVRRAQRHRFRGAGAGNPGHAGRAGRSADQGDAKDLRHHRRQRRECRHRARRPADPPDGRRPALDRRAVLSQRPAGRDRACRRRAQSSRHRVAWLANKIAPNGLALEAGQVVLAGSFIRPIETRKGDTIQADYGPYGSVSCYFA